MKRSDVTGNRFECQLGEKNVILDPLPIFYCISSVTTLEGNPYSAGIDYRRQKMTSVDVIF